MPSRQHESLLFLFRNRPMLAADLLRDVLHVDLPRFTGVQIDSADLTQLQPAEYRADLVLRMLDDVAAYGIVVEVQLRTDHDKEFAWPAYVTNLRARHKVPVCLFVVATNEATARWASQPIELGGGNVFTPSVLRPSVVPQIVDESEARTDPELAVLSAIAHGKARDPKQAARIAAAAQLAALDLDGDRSRLYLDLVFAALGKAAQRELRAMDPAKYEYQSAFAKRFVAKGKAEGKVEGKASIVVRQLARRFGALPPQAAKRISAASPVELDAIAERLLTARSLEAALGTPRSRRRASSAPRP